MSSVLAMINDPVRDALWARVYAAALERGIIWFEAQKLADQAVVWYDRRPAIDPNVN